MFFRSIRFKMMLWYMLLLTVTLLSFSSVLYGSFRKILYDDLDDLLSSKAEGIVNSIGAYWSAHGVAGHGTAASQGDFINSAGEWVESKRRDPELMGIFVTILDGTGRRLVASKNAPRLEPLPEGSIEDIKDGEDSFDTLKGELSDGKRARIRAYSRPVGEDGKLRYIVQVSASVELLTLATHNLVWVLFLLLPLTVFLAGLPGVVLVRLTLKPVDEMISTLRRTTAENLKLKIHLPDTKDEIRKLADTFNEMIERLDRSFSSQQSFIRDLSGELRSPLKSLKEEFAGSVREDLPPREYAGILRHGLAEMGRFEKVIEELETLARFDNDRVALEIRKVDLSELLEAALKRAGERARQKDIDLSSVLRETIVIDGDARQLARLFDSLLDNAVKYTNRKGRIALSARKDRQSAIITVSDTGIGMEELELPYIFDRFYQVNKSRIAGGSFGLGLSIAKSVVEMHRGSIGVESKLGQGSVFTVSLPLSYQG